MAKIIPRYLLIVLLLAGCSNVPQFDYEWHEKRAPIWSNDPLTNHLNHAQRNF